MTAIVGIVDYCAAWEFARTFCFMRAFSEYRTATQIQAWFWTSGPTEFACLKIGRGWWTKHRGPIRRDTRCLTLLLVFVLPLYWAVSCAREQSRMAVFIQKSSNVKGNRCQRGNKNTRPGDLTGQCDKQWSKSVQDFERHYCKAEI